MTSPVNYQGIKAVSPSPTRDGGPARKDIFESVADWRPWSVWNDVLAPVPTADWRSDDDPGSVALGEFLGRPELFAVAIAAGFRTFRCLSNPDNRHRAATATAGLSASDWEPAAGPDGRGFCFSGVGAVPEFPNCQE